MLERWRIVGIERGRNSARRRLRVMGARMPASDKSQTKWLLAGFLLLLACAVGLHFGFVFGPAIAREAAGIEDGTEFAIAQREISCKPELFGNSEAV